MFQKNKIYNRILFRISIWFLLLGVAGITAISYSIELQMRMNTEKRITEELLRIKENAELYVCQILMLHNNQINSEGFRKYVNDIEELLKNAGYREIAFYDIKGTEIGSGESKNLARDKDRQDFRRALQQKSAFTLHYGADNVCEVYFSMPVRVRGEQLGLIRFYLDYSELYEREWNTFHSIIHGIILVVGIIYLLIWLMVRRLVSPVRRLAAVSRDISCHFEDGELEIQRLSEEKFYRRRDEIGELAGNYKKMLDVMKEQFDKIEQDKKHILSLLDSRQEFYNNITHELKTPLAVISGYAQLIRENGLADTELFYNGLAQILQESERLHRMVLELLEMQDENGGIVSTPVSVNLAAVLENVTEQMRVKAERYGDELKLEIRERNCYISGWEDKIRQVLINLIDNAVKYGELGQEIQICLEREAEMARVAVANKGPGLTNQEKERIFEPFFRVDKEKSREMGSAGLGLSIANKIMEEHGGNISVESEPGKETVFSLYFPFSSDSDVKKEAQME